MRNRLLFFLSLLAFQAFSQSDSLEIFTVGSPRSSSRGKAKVTGIVTDAATNEPVAGALLAVQPGGENDVTIAAGNYLLNLQPGNHVLEISFLGYETRTVRLAVFADGKLNFKLEPTALELNQVTVSGSRSGAEANAVLSGVEHLDMDKIARQSKLLGEADVLRSLQAVAGVTSVGEGASGFNVRGGNTDENLILQDGNLIFNPVHALGFFSLFHPDLVGDVTLFKGGAPARYGGRLSSVLDVRLREGNDQRLAMKGGVGPATARLALEGPIKKGKASFLVGARGGYLDWILNLAKDLDLQSSKASFYDLTAKTDAWLTPKTKAGFTVFTTGDLFQFADEVRFDYSTTSGAAYLRQLIGEKISLLAQANAGSYGSSQHDVAGNDPSKFSNAIAYRRATLSGFFQPAQSFQMEIGANRTRYEVSPGEIVPVGESIVKAEKLATEQGEETSFFLHNQWLVSNRLEVMAGVRYVTYRSLGADQIYFYQPGAPKTEQTIVDSTLFSDGEKIAGYSGWEPRFSLRFSLSESGSVKLGYNRSFQYLNQISNTAAAAPVDVWQLSNRYVEPQNADNFSVGYEHFFKANALKANLTFFYRRIHKLLEFKDFAQLLLNDHLETELLQGKGKAHGVEVYAQKKQGRSQFELNYTWSRSLRQVAATAEQEGVSAGKWYPSNFDKPHNLNVNYHFQATPKSAVSVNFTYGTGRPTTAPVSIYGNQNIITIPLYSERNQFRIPDYHRLDFAWTIGPWGKRERWQNSLTFSLYNVYFRKNAFSVFFRQQPGQGVEAYRVAVLGTVFPAVTYDFKF